MIDENEQQEVQDNGGMLYDEKIDMKKSKREKNSENGECARVDYYLNGEIAYCAWCENGKLHREGRVPAEIYFNENGSVKHRKWWTNGELVHSVSYYDNGKVKSQVRWEDNNKKCKEINDEEPPTIIKYYENGNVKYLRWRIRKNNPLSIYFYENGNKIYEFWATPDNIIHRDKYPAEIRYFESGSPKSYEWVMNGMTHNDVGPAFVSYHKNGTERCVNWYRNGNLFRENDLPVVEVYHKNNTFKRWIWNSRVNPDDPDEIEHLGSKRDEDADFEDDKTMYEVYKLTWLKKVIFVYQYYYEGVLIKSKTKNMKDHVENFYEVQFEKIEN